MAGNGSPRPKAPARRMLVGVARVAALLLIVIGVSSVLAPDLTRRPLFYVVALAFAVVTFVLLRPPRRSIESAVSEPLLTAPPPAERVIVVDEARIAQAREEERSRWTGEVTKSADAVKRIRQDLTLSEEARTVLTRKSDELAQTIVSLRKDLSGKQAEVSQQAARADAIVAELNAELTSGRAAADKLRGDGIQREREWNEKVQRERAAHEARHNELQRALENERGIREQVAALARELQQQLNQTAAAQGDVHGAIDRERAARERAEAQMAATAARIAELESASQERFASLSSDHENAVGTVIEEREAARAELRGIEMRFKELQRTLETERASRTQRDAGAGEHAQGLEKRIAELQQMVERERANASEKVQAAEQRAAELQQTLDGERAARGSGESAATDHARNLEARIAELQQILDGERSQATEQVRNHGARVAELERTIETERAERESTVAEHARNHATRLAELQNTIDGQRAAHDERESGHQQDLGAALEERETARAEARTLEARVAELQQRLESERGEREQRENDWNQKLDGIVAGMAANHEKDVATAVEARDAARAESRTLTDQVTELQHRLESEHATRSQNETEWNERLQHLGAEHGATVERKVAEMQQSIEGERSTRDQLESEWSVKLQKIVVGITADHENDIGDAMMEREAARAEVRHLTNKVHELQRQLENPKTHVVDENAVRAKLETEWSEKLQTIVTHLASDHEADIGKALEEKQEARAEVRTLTMRVTNLQQQIDRDLRMFTTAQEKWNNLRDTLTTKANDAQRELQAMREASVSVPQPAAAPVVAPPSATLPPIAPQVDPFPPPAAVPTPAPFPSPFGESSPGGDEQRARADVLEIAEQAHAVLKRTASGTTPIPRDTRRALILFVHHDPNMRTMWRDQLHKHGYDVITAVDGLEGLRMATAQKPAVVIADAQMPKMDGRELCRMLKSNDETMATKVVLMSGDYSNESVAEGIKPDELLRKPVKFDALQAVLANLLAAPQ